MLPLRFNVGSVSNTKLLADIELAIKDEKRNLLYTSSPKASEVPISYIGMPEATVENIEIINANEALSDIQVFENSVRERVRYCFTRKSFRLSSRDTLITDVVYRGSSGRPQPLYYRHIIKDGVLTEPVVLDESSVQIPALGLLVVEDGEVAFYHDLAPIVTDNRLEAYYISYTNEENRQIVRLLDSQPAYRKAEILDGADLSKRTYSVRRRANGYEYRILYRGSGPFYVKTLESGQLKLRKPTSIRAREPWHPQVTNAKVIARVGEETNSYSIREFPLQSFDPIEPIMSSGTAECILASSSLVKLPKENVLVDEDRPIDILVTDKSLNPLRGWSSRNESNPYWIDRMSQFREQGRTLRYPLRSFDTDELSLNSSAGLVSIPFKLTSEHRVFARFKYEEKNFTYRSLNVNPAFNEGALTNRFVLYAIPDSLVAEDLRSIYHIELDGENNIVSWNDTRLGDGVLDPSLMPGPGENGYDLFKDAFPNFLIIGSIAINRTSTPDDFQFIDIREIGGVLTDKTEADLPKLIESYPELQWISNRSLSSRPIPAHGGVVIRLPFNVLKRGGGVLSDEAVRERVKKHLPLGAYPIIEYYAEKPEVLGIEVNVSTSELTVTWREASFADSYRIYLGGSPDQMIAYDINTPSAGAFQNSLEKTFRLTGATIVDINLPISDNMYLYIAPIKDSEEWPQGDMVAIDTTLSQGQFLTSLSALITAAPSNTIQANAIIT